MPKPTAILVSLTLLLLVAGCRAQPTTSAVPTLTAPVEVPLSTSTLPPTLLAATPIQPPPTTTPSAAPTVTPESQLKVRQPTQQQLQSYLASEFPDFPKFVPNAELLPEDVDGDGEMDWVVYDEDFGVIALALVYKDVNNDQEADLVLYGYDGLFILLWAGQAYAKPFHLQSQYNTLAAKYGSDIKVTFQDWTGDNVFEVVYDEAAGTGGVGLQMWPTRRFLVRCIQQQCNVIWQDTIADHVEDFNTGGLALAQTHMNLGIDNSGQPELRVIHQGFALYCCSEMELAYPLESLRIHTSTLALYAWNGTRFTPREQQIVNRAYTIEAQSTLLATSTTGVTATIAWQDNRMGGNANEYCQLWVAELPVGAYWGCRHKFTTVAWQDLTGDAQAEIVIITYSAGYPYDPDGGLLSTETCMHQRLLAYGWDGRHATEIANIAGCVIAENLYGVRLQDLDEDGVLEVLAAPNGKLQNRAYKWNGSQFVLWSNVPLR